MKQVIQAHGANRGAHCAVCRAKYDPELMQQAVRDQKVLFCDSTTCKSKQRPIKPDITFFGEALPEQFTDLFNPGKSLMN